MKLKKFTGIVLSLLLAPVITISASEIFSVKTALNMTASQKNCGISVLSGKTFEFSAKDLEMRLGLSADSLDGITVISLPKPEQGEFILEGKKINAFEFISRADINKLRFVPGKNAAAAHVTFIPKSPDSSTTQLIIKIVDAISQPPHIIDVSYDTVKNVAIWGCVETDGFQSREMEIRVVSPPSKGMARFDGLSFYYTPYLDKSGKDSFTICVIDSMDNFSNEAVININIGKQKNSFYYTDMTGNPYAYAAIRLHEKGIMSGRQIGNGFFFYPDEPVDRGNFLIMLMSAGGLNKYIRPAANTGLPDDKETPVWLKPYIKAAVGLKLLSPEQPFYHSRIMSRAEAVVMADKLSGASDNSGYELRISDYGDIPHWALQSYRNLDSNNMLSLYDNMARPLSELTNSYAAGLLSRITDRK